MKRKTKITLFDKLKGFIPLFIFLGTIANFIIIYRYESKSRPQIIYTIATNQVENVIDKNNTTNIIENIEHEKLEIKLPNIYNVYYDYFTLQGLRTIKMFERYYNEGSKTSYGIIKSIFPDKVFLENGDILVNQKFIGYKGESLMTEQSKKVDNNVIQNN